MLTDSEAVQVVTYLNRTGLLPAMEGQAPVWQDSLGNVNAADSLEACRNISRKATGAGRGGIFVTPGELLGEVRRIRAKRTEGVEVPAPPAALADRPREQMRFQRAYMWQVGNGATPEQADQFACERAGAVRELTAGPAEPGRVRRALAGVEKAIATEPPMVPNE